MPDIEEHDADDTDGKFGFDETETERSKIDLHNTELARQADVIEKSKGIHKQIKEANKGKAKSMAFGVKTKPKKSSDSGFSFFKFLMLLAVIGLGYFGYKKYKEHYQKKNRSATVDDIETKNLTDLDSL